MATAFALSKLLVEQADLWLRLPADAVHSQVMTEQAEFLGLPRAPLRSANSTMAGK